MLIYQNYGTYKRERVEVADYNLTLLTRLQQAFKLKFTPLFAPITNLLKQT